MTLTATKNETFLQVFAEVERGRTAGDPPFLRRLRQAAIARFDELGLPGPRNEDWKFTSIQHLARIPFRPHPGGSPEDETLRQELISAGEAYQLTFVDGAFNWELSVLPTADAGFTLTALSEALSTHPELVERHLGRHAPYHEQAFTALNTACLTDGAFLHVPRGRQLDRPIYLTFLTTECDTPTICQPRNLLVVEEGATVTLAESYLGADDTQYLTNAVTETFLGSRAVMDHYRIQREGRQATHVSNLYLAQEGNSAFSSHLVSLGGALVRNEAHATFLGEYGECTLNGVYLGRGTQHIDNHTVIDHAQPHCASHELYKGILDGMAQGVFNGKIFVRPDAQKTDAKQTNQTLLLSDDATINTKPQLEIYADDVKCTHGATVGNLREDAVFYLRSRGIGLEAARAMLTYAFANDIVGRIKLDRLRVRLEAYLLAARSLPTETAAKELS